MIRPSIDLLALAPWRDYLLARRAEASALFVLIVYSCALRAANRCALVTPRSQMVRSYDGSAHVHMQDRWDATATPLGAALGNPAPYAWFVAGGTRFMQANPRLAEAIRTLQEYALADAAELLGGIQP